eukprot:2650033-Amphidinium_carterae.2
MCRGQSSSEYSEASASPLPLSLMIRVRRDLSLLRRYLRQEQRSEGRQWWIVERGRPIKLDKLPKTASGIGGKSPGLFVVLLPILFSTKGPSGFLEVTVLKEDVPFLLSAGFLTFLGATIDLAKNELHLAKLDLVVLMRRSSGGHS